MTTPHITMLTASLTGLLGQAPQAQTVTNVANAFTYYITDDDSQAFFGYPKANMTADDAASVAVRLIRSFIKQRCIQAASDAATAANAAAVAAAAANNSTGL